MNDHRSNDLDATDVEQFHSIALDWFEKSARDLPWRQNASPWEVMVSEFMLQQTPVARVLPVFQMWIERWPTPTALASDNAGEAVRAWGRLGYPRRALRLHAAASKIVEEHDGEVPPSYDDLISLPGVGGYTAGAIASFAYGQSHLVIDTNVRRLFARVINGVALAPTSTTAADRRLASSLIPERNAARWAAATMELGAVVCTAKGPRCRECPLQDLCRWRQLGYPAYDGPVRKTQPWEGTDRQCRGRILQLLREANGPVARPRIDQVWDEPVQRERALNGLIFDGLIEPSVDQAVEDAFSLPGGSLH